jgi:beta-N-acetylhexosaminidase
VSDALDMAGASAGRGIPEAAVLSLAAGADLLCLGPDKPAGLVREVQAALLAAVADGRLPLERLQEAAARVAALAASRGVASAELGGRVASASERIETPAQSALVDAAAAALVVEGELPDLAHAMIVSIGTRANIAVGDVPWGLAPDLTIEPAGSLATLGRGPVIVQVRDGHRHPEVLATLDLLAEAGLTPVVVEWGWPGPRHGGYTRICTRGYSRPGAEAVTRLLRKAGWDR